MDESFRIKSKSHVMLQYYIPFRFDDNQIDEMSKILADIRQDDACAWEEAAFPLEDNTIFYAHVLSMMDVRENVNSICQSWKLQNLEGNRYLFIDHISSTEQHGYVFTLENIYLHLCKSGVGFLSYQAGLNEKTLQDPDMMVRFQNRMKKLNITNGQLYILLKADGPTGEKGQETSSSREQVMLGKKLVQLLPEAFRSSIEFFGVVGKNSVPSAALLFSYLCYDCQDRNRLKEITVHMAMGYDLRNKQSTETIQSCHELAGDVFYFVTQNGCAISVIPNKENESYFVRNNPAAKYNFIFFLLLYQHRSLLHFTMRLYTDFPSGSQAYHGNTDYADRMQDFTTDVDSFLMKSDLSTISHIPSYNEFYTVSRKALNIEEDKQSLHSGFESLAGIQQSQMQEKQNRRINIIATILAVLALLPEFCNPEFMGLVIAFFRGNYGKLQSSEKLTLVIFGVMWIAVIGLIIWLWARKPSKSKRKK